MGPGSAEQREGRCTAPGHGPSHHRLDAGQRVGWVERSDTHRFNRQVMGFAKRGSLDEPAILTSASVAANRMVPVTATTRVNIKCYIFFDSLAFSQPGGNQ